MDGYCYKYDISLPLAVFYQAVIHMRERLGKSSTYCVKGQVGREYEGGWLQLQVRLVTPPPCLLSGSPGNEKKIR